jgi:uncharacterized protein (TIGR02594 family)
VLQQSGVAGGFKSAKCSDFLKFGSKIEDARVGAVAVLSREGVPEAVSGMAGFLVRADAQTVTLVVGNVDNQVTVAAYPRRQVREFRWPNGG